MLTRTTQEPRKYRIAAFNERLHENQICPGNHEVGYYNGWYYFDGKPRQAPDITRKAKRYEASEETAVWFSRTYNTYVLAPSH